MEPIVIGDDDQPGTEEHPIELGQQPGQRPDAEALVRWRVFSDWDPTTEPVAEGMRMCFGSRNTMERYREQMGTINNFHSIGTMIVATIEGQRAGVVTASTLASEVEIYGLRAWVGGRGLGADLLRRLADLLRGRADRLAVPPTGHCHTRMLALNAYLKAGHTLIEGDVPLRQWRPEGTEAPNPRIKRARQKFTERLNAYVGLDERDREAADRRCRYKIAPLQLSNP